MKTEWNGGKNPVRKGETCETIWLRSGQPLHGNGDGSCMRWSHEGNGGDIVAYEVTGRPVDAVEAVETLRDRVAMAALTGMMAHPTCSWEAYPAEAGIAAYRMADAFLAARGDA